MAASTSGCSEETDCVLPAIEIGISMLGAKKTNGRTTVTRNIAARRKCRSAARAFRENQATTRPTVAIIVTLITSKRVGELLAAVMRASAGDVIPFCSFRFVRGGFHGSDG